jgi:hypothetical protein
MLSLFPDLCYVQLNIIFISTHSHLETEKSLNIILIDTVFLNYK